MRMKIIGHRGARGLAPENTIASFKKALQHHVDGIEFDLRVTKDNVVIVHHDAELTDPNGDKHIINDCAYAELKRHKPDLATLEEVLQQVGHTAPLYIEVKRKERTAPIIKILKKHLASGWRPSYFLLGSKSQKTLLELHAALPDIEKVVIEPWSGVRAHKRAGQINARIIAMNQLWLWWGFIIGFKNSDKQLYAYPLNNLARAKRWTRWGLAGVITDFPDRFEKRR